MPTNDQDARALTFLACRLRKETYGACEWDDNGTYAEISRMVGQSLPTVVERVTRHASDPEAKTPGAMRRPFLPDAPKAAPAFPPKLEDACPVHGGHRDHCPGCAADRLVGDQTTRPAPARLGPTDEFRQARAALARELLSHPQHEATEEVAP